MADVFSPLARRLARAVLLDAAIDLRPGAWQELSGAILDELQRRIRK